MEWEVEAALRKMKNGKEARKVNIETLKAGDETIEKQLAKLYTKCITERRIPKTWREANMVIFFKKGNRKDIKNYRPICLISNMYKLFTKIIITRLEKKLDENQPREQAGFRSKYSTTDHIHAINQLKEKCREYKKGSFYIAQYPVRWTAQSALHFLPSLADLFIPTPTRLLREAF